MDFGIKYFKTEIDDKTFILIPKELVVGSTSSTNFYTADEKIPLLGSVSTLKQKTYLVDSVKEIEKYKEDNHYTSKDEDIDFLMDYYYADQRNYVLVVSVVNDSIVKNKIKIDDLKSKTTQEIYEIINNQPAVVLNNGTLSALFELNSIEKIKDKLADLQVGMDKFVHNNDENSVNKMTVRGGLISSLETDTKIYVPEKEPKKDDNRADKKDYVVKDSDNEKEQEEYLSNISLKGLEKYINERVLGHVKEVKKIATVLMLNLTATREYGTESILLLGPTGVGKTATFEVASEYLNVPYLIVNTPNLVPSGIKGESLESLLFSLYQLHRDKPEMLDRAIIIMDEFDKLEDTELSIKTAMKQILLKFIEGGTFDISDSFREDVIINTKMFSKMFLGSFSDLFNTKKQIGIGTELMQDKKTIDVKDIYKSGYFNKELLSRISHVVNYLPVGRDIQKKIILESKISTFLRKKERFVKEFGVTTIGEEEFAEALLDRLAAEDKSMRDINNLIDECLLEIQYELLSSPPNKYHKLVLSRETVSDSSNFDLS